MCGNFECGLNASAVMWCNGSWDNELKIFARQGRDGCFTNDILGKRMVTRYIVER